MANSTIKDYRSLDAYRFLAATMVALGHFNEGFQLGLERFTPLASNFGLFVDFFFILSGFVIALNYDGRVGSWSAYGEFLWRRFARIWPLHVAVLLFFLGLAFVGYLTGYTFNKPEMISLSAVPANLSMTHAWGLVDHLSFNAASWSISAEMFVYILFPLLIWPIRRWSIASCLLLVAAMIVMMISARNHFGLKPWYEATYDFGALRAVPSFLLGIIIHRASLTMGKCVWCTWPMAHAIFGIALLSIHGNIPAEIVIALFGFFVFVAVKAEDNHRETSFSGKIHQELGNASYALYMVHMPLMTYGMVIARRTSGLGGTSGWLFAISFLFLAVVLALWLYKGFEDPWRRKLRSFSPFKRQHYYGSTLLEAQVR
jgi:peptidoglycan/LPS O-acetylase OafA/YrhL